MAYDILEWPRHGGLRIGSGLAIDSFSGLNHCWIGLAEIAEAACDYPLVFLKAVETGKFRLVALFGFQPERNVFVLDGQFVATYLPTQLSRAPFALSVSEVGEFSLVVDVYHPRAQDQSGQEVFDREGKETVFTIQTRERLVAFKKDQDLTLDFIQALATHDLLTPMPLDLDPHGQATPVRLDGLYTIHRPNLAELNDEAVLSLHRLGFLGAAQAIANSLAQIVRVQQLHNAHAQRDSNLFSIKNISVGLAQ